MLEKFYHHLHTKVRLDSQQVPRDLIHERPLRQRRPRRTTRCSGVSCQVPNPTPGVRTPCVVISNRPAISRSGEDQSFRAPG